MNDEKYEYATCGWTNYETRMVVDDLLHGYTAEDMFDRKCNEEDVKDYCYKIAESAYKEGSFALSCVTYTFTKVNWHELAEHLNKMDNNK